MRDYKSYRSDKVTTTRYSRTKVKANRKHKEPPPPRDWSGLIHTLAVSARWLGISCAAVGCGTLLVAGGKFMIYDSPFFRVETVQVENAQRVDAEQVCDIADIRRGSSMFSLDLELIGRKIQENPWIASARVERIFPRTVAIKVTEHEPVAIVNLGCLYYVAEDGTVFKPLDATDNIDYPLLSGLNQRDVLDQPEASRQLLAGAVELLHVLASRQLFHLGKISEIRIDPSQGYEMLTIDGGVPIRIGFDNYERKLSRLERIYHELEIRLPVTQYIDLNSIDRVIVKLDPSFSQPPVNQSKS